MMRVRYDPEADVAAFDLLPDAIVVRTEQVDEGTLVDIDAAGDVISIEVIQPTHPWPLEDILERFDINSDHRAMLEWLRQAWFPEGGIQTAAFSTQMAAVAA